MAPQPERLKFATLRIRDRVNQTKDGKDISIPVPARWYWPGALNDGIVNFNDVTETCLDQCFFVALCKRHLVFKTVKTVTSTMHTKLGMTECTPFGTALDCRICEMYNNASTCKQPSAGEQVLYDFLDQTLSPSAWVPEAYAIGRGVSSVDVWVLPKRLFIMVDGPHHFEQVRNKPAEEQQEKDAAFNKLALEQGFFVLRLHHQDQNMYMELLITMLAKCKPSVAPFIQLSPSF